ncbi:hypothetical protein ACFX13_044785 [Malus domestica]
MPLLVNAETLIHVNAKQEEVLTPLLGVGGELMRSRREIATKKLGLRVFLLWGVLPPGVREIDRNRTLVTSETELDARQKLLQISEDEGTLVGETAADAGKDIGVGMEE